MPSINIGFGMFLLGPLVGIFGGAGPPVYRAMMSKIVSADDQGIYVLLVTSNDCASMGGGGLGWE